MVRFGDPEIVMQSTGRWMRVANPLIGWWMGQMNLLAPDFAVRTMEIKRGLEGPQLILRWEAPSVPEMIDELRLVRKMYDFPYHVGDGKVVWSSTTGLDEGAFYSDLDLDDCRCYYYAMFSHRPGYGDWVTSTQAVAAALAIKSGDFFPEKLWKNLPDAYILGDKKQSLLESERGRIILSPVQAEDGEWFNLYENGETPKGELQRYLKLAGTEFDYARGLIRCMTTLMDVDETCCEILPHLARLIGLDLNTELPCSLQREEIKREVFVLKWKGTEIGVAAKARAIARLETRVVARCDQILIFDKLDSGFLPFTDAEKLVFGTPDDGAFYFAGGEYAYRRIGILFEIPCDGCLDEGTVQKLNRVMPDYLPACTFMDMTFRDCTWEEVYDREGRLTEEYWDEMITLDEEFPFMAHWLLFGNQERVFATQGNLRWGFASQGSVALETSKTV